MDGGRIIEHHCPSQESKKIAAEKTLAEAILTVKSFLTGQTTTVKGRIQTLKELKPPYDKKTTARSYKTRKKQSL